MASPSKYRIGLDLGANSIKLVSWHTNKKQEKFKIIRELNLLDEFKLHDTSEVDDTHLMEGIKIIFDKIPKRGADIRVSVSDPVNNLFFLEIPSVNKNEMDEAITWSLSPYLNKPVNDFEKDFKILSINKKRKSHNVLVGTFEKSRLESIQRYFKRAGISITTLTSDQLASSILFLNENKKSVRPVGILDLGAVSTKYSIVAPAGPPAFIKMKFGGDAIDKAMAQSMGMSVGGIRNLKKGESEKSKIKDLDSKLDDAYKVADDLIRNFCKDLILFNYNYVNKHGSQIEKIYLTGGLLSDPWFKEQIQHIMKENEIEIVFWEPIKEKFKKEKLEFNECSKFTNALGLALL